MPVDLINFRRNTYSQNGEDGVVEEILRRLEIGTGSFCEFGAWDGKRLSNTYSLVEKGWSGVEIEADPDKFKELLKTAENHPGQLTCINKGVSVDGENSLDRILSETGLAKDFDLLSIDIDSFDFQVWESLTEYHPKIVIIEVNSGLGGKALQTHTVNEDGAVMSQGSSFASTKELGVRKGYVCIFHYGNVFFLREDLFDVSKFEYGFFNNRRGRRSW
tara:strand:+ start:295 stop:948 length:654 start_codon:yes stop_codon:yes gene_type:complete